MLVNYRILVDIMLKKIEINELLIVYFSKVNYYN